MSLRSFLFAALAALSLDASAITLRLGDDGDPRLIPDPARAGQLQRFANDGPMAHERIRTIGWKSEDGCVAWQRQGLTTLAEPRCAAAGVRLQWDERVRDRVYPALVKLANGGVLVFAGYVQVMAADGARVEDVRLEAPRGGVAAFGGRKSTTALVVAGETFGDQGSGWFYLGPDRFDEEPFASVLVDEGVPRAARDLVTGLTPRVLEVLEESLGRPASRPTFFLTWIARSGGGGSDFQADVVPGAVRFSLVGERWADPDAAALLRIRDTVAHEMVHLWNGRNGRLGDASSPWVSEGAADLLALAALSRAGVITPAEAVDKAQAVLTECLILAGTGAWVAMRGRDMGRIPYACGLAMQVAITAAARRARPSLDALSYWGDIDALGRANVEAVFALEAMRRGDAQLVDALQAMLVHPDVPLAQGLRRLFAMGGVAVAGGAQLPAASAPLYGRALFAALMAADCKGSIGFFIQGDHFLVDAVACGGLRKGMKATLAGGHSLFEAPADAADAVRAECLAGREAVVGTEQGDAIRIACTPAIAKQLPSRESLLRLEAAPALLEVFSPVKLSR